MRGLHLEYFTDEAVQSSGGHHPGHHGRRVQPDAETVLRRAAGAQQGRKAPETGSRGRPAGTEIAGI